MPRGTRSFLRNTFAARRENAARRRRHADGLKGRRLINETLENRQLLAGPDLVGIQPNEGELLVDGTVLNVSPRELTFRFTDDTVINPDTLGGIRITRAGDDGVFESARATSDLGTAGATVLEFRSRQAGIRGEGLQVVFTNAARGGSSVPLVDVDADGVVRIELNSTAGRQTRVGDLVAAVENDPEAGRLLEVIPVTGAAGVTLGGVVPDGTEVTLIGANAAESVTDLGTGGDVRVRFVSNLPGADGRGTTIVFDQRNFGPGAAPVVLASGNQITVQLNTTPGFESTAAEVIGRINSDPAVSELVTAVLQEGDPATRVGGFTSTLTLAGANDVSVAPGFVGVGDSPNEVIFRFAEPLPDDIYQIDILGTSTSALLGAGGMPFNDGQNLARRFAIDLGPRVVAVVPEPVRRDAAGNAIAPARGQIDVYFDEPLTQATAENASAYQLIFTRDTADNTDDTAFVPADVRYNVSTNTATLFFSAPLARLTADGGAARLRIGTVVASPASPADGFSIGDTPVAITPSDLTAAGLADEAADTGDEALRLTPDDDPQTPELPRPWVLSPTDPRSVVIDGEISNETPFALELPGPGYAGVRDTRSDDPARTTGVVPLDYVRRAGDTTDGVTTLTYDFAATFRGDDPNRPGVDSDRTYFNSITEIQRQRVREALSVFNQYLGVNFVEVETLGGDVQSGTSDFTIAVGDLYGADVGAASGDGGLVVALGQRTAGAAGSFDDADLVVLDLQDFDESVDDTFGEQFFRGALFGIGQFLGYGYADDLPQPVTQSTSFVLEPGDDNEALYPSPVDVINGQFLYRPDSTDVDLYRFDVPAAGTVKIETIAQRLASASTLDSTMRLFRQVGDDYVQVAGNDDYFSNDSFIELGVTPGTYVLGVSASGNDTYSPLIDNSGFGGRSQGEYQLRMEYAPSAAGAITDRVVAADLDGDGDTETLPATSLDGDGDGRPGGVFNFWFEPADANDTFFVDKSRGSATGASGLFNNAFAEIDQALAAAETRLAQLRLSDPDAGITVHVLGSGGADGRLETVVDNDAYTIGFAQNGVPLADGSSLDVPAGVNLVIDSGAILKLSRARIGVGSDSPTVDRSGASIQVLGTPSIVYGTGGSALPVRGADGQVIPGNVFFTSVFDDELAAGSEGSLPQRVGTPGDWGGIDLRGNFDAADQSRVFAERDGVFLNHIQFADLRYGGGGVAVGGVQRVVSPIEMAVTRPTVFNSVITDSADAAMAATPDTFAFDRFTTPATAGGGSFTADYERIGPDIGGNRIVDNTINGLFIRVDTRGGLLGSPAGGSVEQLNVTGRFDDTDIVHVLTENLSVAGNPGGPVLTGAAPSTLLTTATPLVGGGAVPAGTYRYRLTLVDSAGIESAASDATGTVTLAGTGAVRLNDLPAVPTASGYVARRLYRAAVDPATGLTTGPFRLVGQINASTTTTTDAAAAGTTVLSRPARVLRSRLDGSMIIDPGATFKMDGSRIEARFDANVIAEGTGSLPIVMTSLQDDRYGTGGTFDTASLGGTGGVEPGQWGGVYLGQGASGHFSDTVLAGGGGQTRIEGGFAGFGVLEVHQAELRLADSRVERNAAGVTPGGDPSLETRAGRGAKTPGAIYVRGSQPVIVANEFVDNTSVPMSFDVNSFGTSEVFDTGRATGGSDILDLVGNRGPLIEDNLMDDNDLNGLEVRGGVVAAGGVLDDVGVVHIVREAIEVPNQYVFGGLRLQSDARGSLVVKFQNGTADNAGIVAGGRTLSATDDFGAVADRIGGSLQVVGTSDFPVVLTSLNDDSVGAGFDLQGRPQLDTNGDDDVTVEQEFGLPTGPEVNQGLFIDNDVPTDFPGYFGFTGGPAGVLQAIAEASATSQGLTQVFPQQAPLFDYGNFIDVGADGGAVRMDTLNITEDPVLIANDRVRSAGEFDGPNGTIQFVAEQFFENGQPDLVTEFTFTSTEQFGDVRFINYYDPVLGQDSGDILFTEGTPGEDDFRLTILDGPEEIGFRQFGSFSEDAGLTGASYEGWIADDFPELINAPEFDAPFVPEGTVDPNVPLLNDPDFPQPNYGPGILTSALGWLLDPTATTATITVNLELIAQVFGTDPGTGAAPGDWSGVTIREGSYDRNVPAVPEVEATRVASGRDNQTPSEAQFLGELAPDESSSDENRRLGFVVDGAIATRDDADTYALVAQAGTEVYFDIDRTSMNLDTVVELVDINGVVLVGNDGSIEGGRGEPVPVGGRGGLYYDASRIDPATVLPLVRAVETEPVQRFTLDRNLPGQSGQSTVTVRVGTRTSSSTVENLREDAAGTITALITAAAEGLDADDFTVTTFRSPVDGTLRIDVTFDDPRFLTTPAPTVELQITGVGVTSDRRLSDAQLQDRYSTNPRDAGFRVILPGTPGQRNLYHVRVRSAAGGDPLDNAQVADTARVPRGLSTGGYQLQVRLRAEDERPGTMVKQSDVRFAEDGLRVIGAPLRSELFGEVAETPADNDTPAAAQPLTYFAIGNGEGEANIARSDQLAKTFSGTLADADDVDFYTFDVEYDFLNRFGVDQLLSAVIDLDYASGLGRPDMAFYVFDGDGNLVLAGDDSNIASDRPGGGADDGVADTLAGGSVGTSDPYIGAQELSRGTYFIAVTRADNVPPQLTQFFAADAENPLVRLEPALGTTRIVEDHIDVVPIIDGAAEQTILFDPASAAVDLTLADLNLFVQTATTLQLVNPFTGGSRGRLGVFDEPLQEVAFTNEGQLFGYSGFADRVVDDDGFLYYQVDSGTAALSGGTPTNLVTEGGDVADDGTVTVVVDNVGITVNALAIAAFQTATGFDPEPVQRGFLVADRNAGFDGEDLAAGADEGFDENILFQFDPDTGNFLGRTREPNSFLTGSGAAPQAIGRIDTTVNGNDVNDVLGISQQSQPNAAGQSSPLLVSGDSFVVNGVPDAAGNQPQVRFEFTAPPVLIADGTALVLDGQTLTVNGTTFEFNTGSRIELSEPGGGPLDLGPGDEVTVSAGGETVTFEFVRNAGAAGGNVPVLLRENGLDLDAAALAVALAAAVNDNLAATDVTAVAGGTRVFFTGGGGVTVASGGGGVEIFGGPVVNAGNVAIDVEEDVVPTALATAIAQSIAAATGVDVTTSGARLILPVGTSVGVAPAPGPDNDVPLTFRNQTNVAPGNVGISIQARNADGSFSGDIASTAVIAARIVDAINDTPELPGVEATLTAADGAIRVIGGSFEGIDSTLETLTLGGRTLGGTVTGIESIGGNELYAVTDAGELFVIDQTELFAGGTQRVDGRDLGQQVESATDLIGIPFQALAAAPSSFADGALRQILFGVTGGGTIYAFDTDGQLQPIFAGGQSSIDTGIPGVRGLDFSTLGENLWHVTNLRSGTDGHGVNASFNGVRGSSGGGSSFAFTYEDNASDLGYLPGEDPDTLGQTFDFPGGATGAIESRSFDLAGYSGADRPYLYFNYFLATDRGDGVGDDSMRVFLVDQAGTSHLLATNDLVTRPGAADDEFDDALPVGRYDDDVDVDVQPLFDTTDTFRQARVSLEDFAGQSGLRLRVEFSTSGGAVGTAGLRAVGGDALDEGDAFTVSGVRFTFDVASAVSFPSGGGLAAAYAGNDVGASFTVNGTTYVLDDGSRTVDADDVAIDLSGRGPLASLTPSDIADAAFETLSTRRPVVGGDQLTFNLIPGSPLVEIIPSGDADPPAITAGAPGLIAVVDDTPVDGVPVRISRDDSPELVALAIQDAVADQLLAGDTDLAPITGAAVSLSGLQVDDAGPLGADGTRYPGQFGADFVDGARDNNFEGAYVDDFVIGFAERGELVTGSDPLGNDEAFVNDGRFQLTNPDEPLVSPEGGSYTVEIRDASEYASFASLDAFDARFRTFDTNQRLARSLSFVVPPAASVADGQRFVLDNGTRRVTFEFDRDGVVSAGSVAIALDDDGGGVDDGAGGDDVPGRLLAAINRPDVGGVLGVRAYFSSGTAAGGRRIELAGTAADGDIVINDIDGVLRDLTRQDRRGDENRDRAGGVLVVEQSRFLFNAEYGVELDRDASAIIAGVESSSVVRYPRNLVELNVENLQPGLVLQSNVMAFNDVGGLRIDGFNADPLDPDDPAAGDRSSAAPVAVDRILNNTIIGGTIETGESSPAESFAGIAFAGGAISFADDVVASTPGEIEPAGAFAQDDAILGPPDATNTGAEPTAGGQTLSLGRRGSVTVAFEDNLLVGSGDNAPDLIVFETGAIEQVSVEVSRDGVAFESVGSVGGLSNTVDLDSFGFGPLDRFAFVRLTDLGLGSGVTGPVGADIDAVGALSTIAVETFTAGGNGLTIDGNASPTVLNNVLANNDVAVVAPDGTSAVFGANTFYRNDTLVEGRIGLGQASQIVPDADVLFVRPSELVFSPVAGAPIIDSSIDSLPQRASLITARSAIGLDASPVIAPVFDVNGQQRVDQPGAQPPFGAGANVFKDRGAADRGDTTGPRVTLLTPQAETLGLEAGRAAVPEEAPFFEIQLLDGVAPADITPGTGIDDGTVFADSLLLFRDGEVLVEGVDYRFGYNPTDNVIRLTPVGGVFPEGAYVVRLLDGNDSLIRGAAGGQINDGDGFELRSADGTVTRFEYETGIRVRLPNNLPTAAAADGTTLTVFDGVTEVTFELDNDGATDATSVVVPFDVNDPVSELAVDLAAAINAAGLRVSARVQDNAIQIIGADTTAAVTSDNANVRIDGGIGVSPGFGLRIENDRGAIDDIADGDTFSISRAGVATVTFEFNSAGGVADGNVAIPLTATTTLDALADALAAAIAGGGLGLAPVNAGGGRVAVGGDLTYSIDTDADGLSVIGQPGQGAAVPVFVDISGDDEQTAAAIETAVLGAGLPGVTTQRLDDRLIIDGITDAIGVGAVGLVDIADRVGNPLQNVGTDGRTELQIFVGGGFDYGDLPAPYITTMADGGPRHGVVDGFSLGATVTPEADALVTLGDRDDGVTLTNFRNGFDGTAVVTVNAPTGQTFFLDAFFDWNNDGDFDDAGETFRYGSGGVGGRIPVTSGQNTLRISVPGDAEIGTTGARFRLSQTDNLGPGGTVVGGEVEDYVLNVARNPFQNAGPGGRFDVNQSGAVTPLDALQLLNALRRAGTSSLPLTSPLPAFLPPRPDVDGNGRLTAVDALAVLEELRRINGQGGGEGESTFVATEATGVLASTPTAIIDELDRVTTDHASTDRVTDAAPPEIEPVVAPGSKVSVFDDVAQVALDDVIDHLAGDCPAEPATAAGAASLADLAIKAWI